MSGYNLNYSKKELVDGLEEITRQLWSGDSAMFRSEVEKDYLIKLLDIKHQEELLFEQNKHNNKML